MWGVPTHARTPHTRPAASVAGGRGQQLLGSTWITQASSPPSSTMENEKIYSILAPDLAQLAPWLCRWPYRPRWAFNTFVTLIVSWSPSHLSSLTRASISIWTTFSSLYVVANWTCSKSSTETKRKYAGPHHISITINYKWVFNFLFKYCVTCHFPGRFMTTRNSKYTNVVTNTWQLAL